VNDNDEERLHVNSLHIVNLHIVNDNDDAEDYMKVGIYMI